MRNPSGRARFEWIEDQLAAADLTNAEKVLCARLGLHLNDDTGICNPSYETLATGTTGAVTGKALRNAERNVKRLKASLEKKGRIACIEGGGRGLSNQYLLLTAKTVTGVTPFHAVETVATSEGMGDVSLQKGCRGDHLNNKKNNKRTPGSRLSSSSALRSASDDSRDVAKNAHANAGATSGSWKRNRDDGRDALAELRAKNRDDFAANEGGEARGREALQPAAAAGRR